MWQAPPAGEPATGRQAAGGCRYRKLPVKTPPPPDLPVTGMADVLPISRALEISITIEIGIAIEIGISIEICISIAIRMALEIRWGFLATT